MRLSFKKNTIFYPKGVTRSDVIKELGRRISKRKIEIERREWIAKQYELLVKKTGGRCSLVALGREY